MAASSPESPKPGAQATAFWLGPTLQRLNRPESAYQARCFGIAIILGMNHFKAAWSFADSPVTAHARVSIELCLLRAIEVKESHR